MKYTLSYTSLSLAVNETIRVSGIYRKICDWSKVKNEVLSGGFLPKNKHASTIRMLTEVIGRAKNLTSEQLVLLLEGDLEVQKQLSFLSVCKTYRLILEFIVDVVRNKYLVFDYQIIDSDYASFFNEKAINHPELENLSESTQKKLRQVMFKMMEQANIIDSAKNRIIQPQLIDSSVIQAIVNDNAELLKIFFFSDQQIAILKASHGI